MKKGRIPFYAWRVGVGLVSVFSVCCASPGDTIIENFTSDPANNGWKVFGDTNLFQWDSTNHNLAVTWDSSKTNSYFYRPLGNILAAEDNFSLEFDLNLADAVAGGFGSQLAVGFLRLSDATSPGFLRTQGTAQNVAEFDYFPPSMIDPSIDATLIDASNNFYFGFNTVPLNNSVVYHVRIAHVANDPKLNGDVFTNGVLYTSLTNTFPSATKDFRLDTIAVANYGEDGFGDTILAHGTVSNLVVTLPPPPVQNLAGSFSNTVWQVQFNERTNWLFTLERSQDLLSWTNASTTTAGVPDSLILQDTNAPVDKAFYRVNAQRP